MKINWYEIKGLEMLESPSNFDERGFLRVIYDKDIDRQGMAIKDFLVQRLIMVSSKRGTLRGIHKATRDISEIKLVSCISGTVREVLVDLRPESPTFKRHTEIILESSECQSVIVPSGIGQAYEVLSDKATVIYAINTSYLPDKELFINALDPELNIQWGNFTLRSQNDLAAKNVSTLVSQGLI